MAIITITSVEFSQEAIPFDFPSHEEPDPSWCYVDKAGQEHRWGPNGTLPTLEKRTRSVPELCGECGTPTGEMEEELIGYFVLGTDEKVEPGYRMVTRQTHNMPGRLTASGTFVSEKKPPMDRSIAWSSCGWKAPGERPELEGGVFVVEAMKGKDGMYRGTWVPQGVVQKR